MCVCVVFAMPAAGAAGGQPSQSAGGQPPAAMSLYINTRIGAALIEALDELVMSKQIINKSLAVKVSQQFETSMHATLPTENAKVDIKGNLLLYNFVDGVWKGVVDDARVTITGCPNGVGTEHATVDRVKIVAMDTKLFKEG